MKPAVDRCFSAAEIGPAVYNPLPPFFAKSWRPGRVWRNPGS